MPNFHCSWFKGDFSEAEAGLVRHVNKDRETLHLVGCLFSRSLSYITTTTTGLYGVEKTLSIKYCTTCISGIRRRIGKHLMS